MHHGEKDDLVPLRASQEMATALEKAGADVKFTRYSDLQHDSWTAAYGNLEVYRWMYDCKRMVEGDEVVVPDDNNVTLG